MRRRYRLQMLVQQHMGFVAEHIDQMAVEVVGITVEQGLHLVLRRTAGRGLGLAIVARVIETHRGEVKVKSELGKGTAFTITLPVG